MESLPQGYIVLFVLFLLLTTCTPKHIAAPKPMTGNGWAAIPDPDVVNHWLIFVKKDDSDAEKDALNTVCDKKRFVCFGPPEELGKVITIERADKLPKRQ